MNKRLMILIAAALLVGAGIASAQFDEPDPIPRDRIAEEPIPVERPDDGRQVLYLEFDLVYQAGRLQSAELASSERIDSIAPKVFLRRGGTWLVELGGSRELSFRTFDPGWREVELGDADQAGERLDRLVAVTGSVRWPLVVPLYVDGESFEVERITISDVNTGELVFDGEV